MMLDLESFKHDQKLLIIGLISKLSLYHFPQKKVIGYQQPKLSKVSQLRITLIL